VHHRFVSAEEMSRREVGNCVPTRRFYPKETLKELVSRLLTRFRVKRTENQTERFLHFRAPSLSEICYVRLWGSENARIRHGAFGLTLAE
jgi:hypothetical protein